MLQINREAWSRLEVQRRKTFLDSLGAEFAVRFPNQALDWRSAAGLRQLDAVLARGEAWGLKSSKSLKLHALASKVVGIDYAESIPAIGAVLMASFLGDDIKRLWLESWLDGLRRRSAKDGR